MRTWLGWALVVVAGCSKDGGGETADTADTGDTGEDTDDTSDTSDTSDTDTGDTGDTDTGDTGDTDTGSGGDPYAVPVTGADAQCDGGDAQPPGLSATSPAAGTIVVHDEEWGDGCCPEFVVDALLDPGAGTITCAYTIVSDPCDCTCFLDADYAIESVPAGTWTVWAGTRSVVVTVR